MKMYMIAALAVMSFATPVMADSIKAEVKLSDPTRKVDSTEYNLEYTKNFNTGFNFGVEVAATELENKAGVSAAVSGKIGYNLPTVFGLSVVPRVEVGHAFRASSNFEFWGAEVNVSRPVYGPISLTAGYRHREGFHNVNQVENRLSAGANYSLTDTQSLGLRYLRSRGTRNSDSFGVSYGYRF